MGKFTYDSMIQEVSDKQKTKEMRELLDKIMPFFNEFIVHTTYELWGVTILAMDKYGRSFFRIYFYHDNLKAYYLDMLDVCDEYRHAGIATGILETFENICRKLHGDAYLWVKNGTWVYNWYTRKGYVYFSDYKKEKATWMKKIIT